MKPGVKRIIAGVALLGLGVIVAPLAGVLSIIHDAEQAPGPRFKVPGKLETTVTEPGRYYLWNEYRVVLNGKTYDKSKDLPDGVEIHVLDESGHPLDFLGDTSASIQAGSEAKNSIGYVTVEKPGKLEIDVSGNTGDRVMSFSRSAILKTVIAIVLGFGAVAVTAVLGLALIVWGLVRLGRSNREQRANSPIKLGS